MTEEKRPSLERLVEIAELAHSLGVPAIHELLTELRAMRKENVSLREDLANAMAERDAAVSVGTQLERERNAAADAVGSTKAALEKTREVLAEVHQWRQFGVGLAPQPQTDAETLGQRISNVLSATSAELAK